MQIFSSCNGVNILWREAGFTVNKLTLFKVKLVKGELGLTASTMASTWWSVSSLAHRSTSLLLAMTWARSSLGSSVNFVPVITSFFKPLCLATASSVFEETTPRCRLVRAVSLGGA